MKNTEVNDEVVESLVKLIREVVREELNKEINTEKYYDGIVKSVSETNAVVEINGKDYTLPNKSGETLSATDKDAVRVYSGNKFMTDAYIGVKL